MGPIVDGEQSIAVGRVDVCRHGQRVYRSVSVKGLSYRSWVATGRGS